MDNNTHFKSDENYIYLEDKYMEFYIPMYYFDEKKKFALEFNDHISVFGLFTVGIFNGTSFKEFRSMNNPYMIHVYTYDTEIRDIDLPGEGITSCKVLKFYQGNKIMNNAIIIDSDNAVQFLKVLNGGKIPHSIPYSKIHQVWKKNQEMSGVDFGVRNEVEEMIISVCYRNRNNMAQKFCKSYGSDLSVSDFDYTTANIRQICQYAATFTALTFEDLDSMVTTSLNRTREKTEEAFTPVEDIIKM